MDRSGAGCALGGDGVRGAHQFLPREHEGTLLCTYDLTRMPAYLVADVLATHEHAIINGGAAAIRITCRQTSI